MRLATLAETTDVLRETSSRKAKAELLADLLKQLDGPEIVPAIGFLLATPRQGAIGVGWATVARVDASSASAKAGPDPEAGLEEADGPDRATGGGTAAATTSRGAEADILGFDRLLSDVLHTVGPGSEAARAEMIGRFLARCDESEQTFVKRVLVGDARQGALAGVMTDAVAKATGIKAAVVRRAVMLRGDLGETAAIALIEGLEAVEAIDLEVGRPIQPMLAATAPSVEAAVAEVGHSSVEWKLDGARIQVHITPDQQVSIYTRNLNDVTDRLPQVAAVARSLSCSSAVLDGEVLGFFGDEDKPRAFQETMSALGTDAPGPTDDGSTAPDSAASSSAATGLRPYFFDLMYLNGESLIDRALSDRLLLLAELAPDHVVPQRFTDDAEVASAHLDRALAKGHEGVMVKAADSRYEAGRRGKTWRKVKPVHTLDLVVLAAEWGHGRRRGWLSNLHLGARDAETGEFVMVGKTFKGLTDDLLRWQTEKFQTISTEQSGHVVHVRPELVVEIALDGAQSSTRYPGGVALRFARVRGYRPDRDAATADTIDAVRALLPGR